MILAKNNSQFVPPNCAPKGIADSRRTRCDQFRRGVATAIAGLSKDPLAAKGPLRHSSLATTDRHYLKNVPENTLAAMNQLEKLCNSRATAEATSQADNR
jgi:hypothetical protein